MESLKRFFQKTNQSFFLFGPRGTGKSFLIKILFPQALCLDLLDQETFRNYASRPERLRELMAANPSNQTVMIDEIQKIPALLDVVHQLIEAQPTRQFILTGSSARKLKRAGVNLLAGRALNLTLHPFMAAELGQSFNLAAALEYGLIPLIQFAQQPAASLRAYVSLYLKEEVQQEALVRNIGSFARFLEVISLSHATVINLTNIARECSVGQKTVAGYLSVLEDLLLAYRIPIFKQRAKRAVITHEKLYIFDAGVFRALRPQGPLDTTSELNGQALEGLVVEHLRAWNAYRGNHNKLFYWRTRSGVEVDSIIYGPDGLWAFEVKNSTTILPADLRSLRSFQSDYPESKVCFLYRGKERLLKQGVLCLPVDDFLSNLRPERLPFTN